MSQNDVINKIANEVLAKKIRDSYKLIEEREAKLRLTDDDQEISEIKKKIAELWEQIRDAYLGLGLLHQIIPGDIRKIVARAPWIESVDEFIFPSPVSPPPLSSSPVHSTQGRQTLFEIESKFREAALRRRFSIKRSKSSKRLRKLKRRGVIKKSARGSVLPAAPVQLRLDAAVPEQVSVGKPFVLAVAVRLPSSPRLSEDELTRARSSEMMVAWPAGAPFIRLRLEVSTSDCDLKETASCPFRLYSGHDSLVLYFHLIPRHTGDIRIVVKVFQKRTTLGSTRLLTQAQEEEVGMVKLKLFSEDFVRPPSLLTSHTILANTANVLLGIVVLGIVTNLISGVISGQLSSRALWITVPLGLASGLALVLINLHPRKRKSSIENKAVQI
jgi:hypothetical protein